MTAPAHPHATLVAVYPAFVQNMELRINRKFEFKEFIPCKNS